MILGIRHDLQMHLLTDFAHASLPVIVVYDSSCGSCRVILEEGEEGAMYGRHFVFGIKRD